MNKRKLKAGLTNLRGERVGELLVIKRLYGAKGRRPKWLCKCTVSGVGKLLVIKRIYGTKGKRPKWLCKCTITGCGKEIKVSHNRLIDKNNPKTHCGCQRGGLPKQYKKEYHAWWDAKSRCHNPDHPSYKGYGAKGIRMCDRWQKSFEHFLEDMGKVPKGKSLDRKDQHGRYEKRNCRWATDKEQARNKKDTKYVEHPKSKKQVPAAQLAEELGKTYQQLRNELIDQGKWK